MGRLLKRPGNINLRDASLAVFLRYSFIGGSEKGRSFMSDFRLFSARAQVARIGPHRPPVNALNQEFLGELTRAARTLAKRNDVWLISITSPLQPFSAGADLRRRFDRESSCYAPLLRTEDRGEALRAFLEKSAPVATGR